MADRWRERKSSYLFLRAPISEDGKVSNKVTIGTPQGGVVRAVLANIMLNELDQLLDSRGIKFVRYADDMVIMCGSRKAAERILENVTNLWRRSYFSKSIKIKPRYCMHVRNPNF